MIFYIANIFYIPFSKVISKKLVVSFKHMAVVWQTFPGKIAHTCLPTPDRAPRPDQSIHITKVQLGKSVSYWSYLQCRNDSETAASPMPTPLWVAETGNLGTWSTLHILQADQRGWRVTFLGDSVVLNLIQAALLVFVSFRQFISAFFFRLSTISSLQLGLFVSDSYLFTPGERGI